ncbi:MAG: histidine kinase [Bacteroidota bacterium]
MYSSPDMPFRWQRLLLLFIVVYLAIFHLSDFLEAESVREEWERFTTLHALSLLVFTGVAFFSYSLVCYMVLYFLFDRIPWAFLLLILAMGIFVCMPMRAFWEEVIVKAISGTGNYNPKTAWGYYLADQILYALIFCPLGIVFYLLQRARFIEQAGRVSDTLRVEAELKYLRSQVNPHFLFNTLNNLYSLVHQSSPLALPALEKLSGLLRYSLYEKEALVPIAREMEHLQDLIHLEEMRVENITPAVLEVEELSQDWCLPPLLLVPFVENAFKHGDLRKQPLLLKLAENEVGDLIFTSQNKIRKGPVSKDGTGGIGLANVRKRLELLYPEEHNLAIHKDGAAFTVSLRLARVAARRCKGRFMKASISAKAIPTAGNQASEDAALFHHTQSLK